MKKIFVLAFLIAPLHASAPAKKPQKRSQAGQTIQYAAFTAAQGQAQLNLQQQDLTQLQRIFLDIKSLKTQLAILQADVAKSDKQYAEKLASFDTQHDETRATIASFKISMSTAHTNFKLFQDKVYALERAAQRDAVIMQQFMNSWAVFAYSALREVQRIEAIVNTAITKFSTPVVYYIPYAPQQVSTSPATASAGSAASTSPSSSPEMTPLTLQK